MRLAKKACELANWKSSYCLTTLAAAYAEAGDFEEAVKFQRKSIELGFPKDDLELAHKRLDLYKNKKPYAKGSALGRLKTCPYCGKKNDPAAVRCGECGTTFGDRTESKWSGTPNVSPAGVAMGTGLGVLLVSTALFFVIGTIMLESGLLPDRFPEMYSPLTSNRPAPYIAIAAIIPIILLCRRRWRELRAQLVASFVIVIIVVATALLPRLKPQLAIFWCIPASLLALVLPLGLYFGVMVQLLFGVWLLVRFKPVKLTGEEDNRKA